MTDESKSLIPSDDEIHEILAQVLQAQAKQDPRNLPVAILQAWIGQVMIKAFNKIGNEYGKSSNEFRVEVEKAIRRLEDSIDNK